MGLPVVITLVILYLDLKWQQLTPCYTCFEEWSVRVQPSNVEDGVKLKRAPEAPVVAVWTVQVKG